MKYFFKILSAISRILSYFLKSLKSLLDIFKSIERIVILLSILFFIKTIAVEQTPAYYYANMMLG